MSKFKKGDKVRVTNYGSKMMFSSQQTIDNLKILFNNTLFGSVTPLIEEHDMQPVIRDINPEIIGKEGIIEGSYFDLYGGTDNEHSRTQYSIKGIPEKTAWYDEEQLELIKH